MMKNNCTGSARSYTAPAVTYLTTLPTHQMSRLVRLRESRLAYTRTYTPKNLKENRLQKSEESQCRAPRSGARR